MTVRGWRLLVAALIGIIALVLTAAVTVAPKAAAEDSEDTTTTTTTTTQDMGTTGTGAVGGHNGEQYPAVTGEQTTGEQTENPSDSSETQSPAAEETTSPESSETETNESNAPPADEPESRQESRAAEPGKIAADVTKITGVPGNGQQLKVGDKASVVGTWEAVDQNAGGVAAGDKFTVGFPSQLKLPAGATFNLIGSDGDVVGQTVGTCTVNADNTFTCVLSENVNDKAGVKGTWFIETQVVAGTDDEGLKFTVPGKEVTVPLPGGGGIDDGFNSTFSKKGEVGADKGSIKWTVEIPGNMLAPLKDPNDGTASLKDVLPEGLKTCSADNKTPTLQVGRDKLETITDGLTIADGQTSEIAIGVDAGKPFQTNQRYVLTYYTCTTDGQPLTKDQEYKNSFTVGTQTTSGTVKGQGFEPEKLSKSGSISGNFDKITWGIRVPGSMVDSEGKVTVSDTFEGDQKICDGGITIKVYRAKDRIEFPDTSRRWEDVTGVGGTNVPKPADDSNSFSTTLTGLTQDASYIYSVKYETCLTKIPNKGETFKNAAEVNGNATATTTNAGSPTSKKSGVLNTTPVTIGGETYPAGTTQTWTVTIPGYDLEREDGTPADVFTATDKFSDTMAVCGTSGDLKDRLNISVKGKGVGKYAEDIDLTGKTTVTALDEGTGFSLKTDKGDDKDFSRARNYTVTYTTCTSSGGQDAQGTTYKNEFSGVAKSATVTQNWNAGGTGTGVDQGSFSLLKSASTSSKPFDENAEFTVKVEEFAPGEYPNGKVENTYDVKVKADGTPVSGHYARGNGWTIRLTETGFPNDAGVLWGPGTFIESSGVTVDDQGRAIVAITPKSNVAVQLKNTAKLGELTVTKKVDATDVNVDPNLEFKVTAHVTEKDGEGSRDIPFTLKANESYTLKDLPIGAVVTFDETQPSDTDLISWGTPKFDPSSLKVSKETTEGSQTVTLTNTANQTKGSFTVAKKVVGPEANNSAVPKTFDVKATWTDSDGNEQSKTLTVPTDGDAVDFGEQLPGGTQVTLEELVPANGDGLAWATPAFSGEGVKTVDGKTVVTVGKDVKAVTVTNTVDKNDGTLRLTKTVSGEAADLVGEDAEFTVKASWKDGDVWKSTELKVSKGQITNLGQDLPVGTEVKFEEIGRPDVAGVEWGSITWGVAGDQTCPQVVTRTAQGEPTTSWLNDNGDGTATGIISDNPECGRLISLNNEAKHSLGKVEFEKQIVTEDGDTISVAEAVEKGLLPDTVSFDVTVTGVDVPAGQTAPEDAVKAGDTVTLNKDNNWKWTSGDLPKGTVVTFDEVTPAPLPGVDWAKPLFDKDNVAVEGGKTVTSQIRNTIVPTTETDIVKTVTGPLAGHLAKKTTFEVTASWTDTDGFDRTCVFTVKNGESAVPNDNCDATVIDGKVYFPQGTEITFEETGASEESRLLTWKDVKWTVEGSDAKLESEDKGDRFPTVATVTIKGDSPVTIGLENESGPDGIIIIPIIPIIPVVPPTTPVTPTEPGTPVNPETPTTPVDGTPGHPGQPMPEQPSSSSSGGGLANTGASVIGLAALALILVGGGAWLMLRNRRNGEA
ncbi:DUF5979 domain-containing protein [Corynebacterium variabile]|uniref:DUF5979 domain-containing protein n=1 Tax=Corynebacterium variabile TaxID=1727 RepID=UPI003F9C762C